MTALPLMDELLGTSGRALPPSWTALRACANEGCMKHVAEYRDEESQTVVAVHVDDGSPEVSCAEPPFSPTDSEVTSSSDPDFLRRILNPWRMNLHQAMLALANPACPADLVAEYRERTRGFRSPSPMRSQGWFLAGLAARTDNTDEDWRAMRRSQNVRVHAALASNPHAPKYILDSLFKLSAVEVWLGLARNPAVDPNRVIDAVGKKSTDPIEGWQWFITLGRCLCLALETRSLTREQRAALLARACAEQERNESGFFRSTITLMSIMAGWVRRLPGDVLDDMVRRSESALGAHPDSARGALTSLLAREQPVPAETLEWLAAKMAHGTRPDAPMLLWNRPINQALFAHPNCTQNLLLSGCGHPDAVVRHTAASHEACPEEGKVFLTLIDLTAG